MKKRKKRHTRWKVLRFRKGDHAHNLIVATQRWAHANGGTCVVIGGIGILDEHNPFVPGTTGKYQICVGCLGQMPEKPKAKS